MIRRISVLAVSLVVFVSLARAESIRPELCAIADAFAQKGDLDAAVAALKKANATPKDLLAALRAHRQPEGETKPGTYSVEITDNTGAKTDLLVCAPSAEQIKAHAPKGLGLVVLLHGLGGSSRQARSIGEKIAASGDVIAVAPSAKPLPESEATDEDGIPQPIKDRMWWAYDSAHSFPLEAIRKARSLYPIDPDRIVMSGMSMGGYGTWNIGLRHPDIFSGLAPLAGGISRFTIKTGDSWISKDLCENGRLTPMLSVHGDADSVVPYKPDKEAIDLIASLGGKAELKTMEGVNHDLRNVHQGTGEIGDQLVKWVATQKRNPRPEAVTYVSVSDKLDGAYWLRIVSRTAKVREAKVHAQIDREKNTIVVTATGVEKARVYLDDRILDAARPAKVKVGFSTRAEKKIEPSFEAILESWRSRQDEELVYPAFVEVDPRSVQ
ncbi:MAG TPA: hypothetical protein VFF73_40765 [Planctomycetota bacterium]|nr:hypothetical protein [Planctomycetota bacterium]